MIIKKYILNACVSLLVGCFLSLPVVTHGQTESQAALPKFGETSDPNYRLSVRDRISISVFDEPGLTMAQGIDAKGEIRVPLINTFHVQGMTIREVEKMLEQQYVEQKYLRNPIVTIDILTYSPKEVSVLGAISRPGQIPFPPEVEKIDIVELISIVGGFTPLAKSKDVR
ncbi:MAG: polysaccharide export protein, partial [Verrucomicrobia bacterium]|nr:polysaccharide export protein [Verrucomicrobiota bacterium]